MSPKKAAPVIPVIGGGQGGDSREQQLREWEKRQAQNRAAQQAAAAPPAPLPVQAVAAEPAQAEAPAATVPAESARVAAAGYLPMPEFTQPDSEDPAERLEFYARGIHAVQYAARANHERAEQQRLIGLGLRLRAMKEEELHKTAGFETFGELTEARFGIKKHQANNILRVLGVAQALEDITTQELKERPLRVLVPILETHGAEAVREAWQEAARHGNVTDTALKNAANFLGYGPPKELEGPEPAKKPAVKPTTPTETAAAVQWIRSLAETDRERARREAEELQREVEQLIEELTAGEE